VSHGSKPNRDLMLLFFLIIDTQNINHLERKIQRRNEREMDNTDQQKKMHYKVSLTFKTLDRRKEQKSSLAMLPMMCFEPSILHHAIPIF
jgi:hypothetical protein